MGIFGFCFPGARPEECRFFGVLGGGGGCLFGGFLLVWVFFSGNLPVLVYV